MNYGPDTCALWYERFGQTRYDLFDNEQGAAGYACYLTYEGQGAPIGVQFADGRTLRVVEWPAFAERSAAWEESERAETARAVEPRPTRAVQSPFSDVVVDVETGAPEWLGRQPLESR
jgi:hypothetical protein